MTVHTLKELMDVLGKYRSLTDEEQAAARIVGEGLERELPRGRVWPLLNEADDPALWQLESIAQDVAEIQDSLALIEDRLTELKRQRLLRPGGES